MKDETVFVVMDERARTIRALKTILVGKATIVPAYRNAGSGSWVRLGQPILYLDEQVVSAKLDVVTQRLMAIGVAGKSEVRVGGLRGRKEFPTNLVHLRYDTAGPEMFALCALALLADDGYDKIACVVDSACAYQWRSLAELVVPNWSVFCIS